MAERQGGGLESAVSSLPEVRVLTVRQPWAWAIVHGGKDVENRVRNIVGSYRGIVAVQVALKADASAMEWPSEALREAQFESVPAEGERSPGWWRHAGQIIGVVELVGVHDSRLAGCGTRKGSARLGEVIPLCSEWADPWSFHLVLANPRPLVEPMPFRGALHLQKTSPEVAAEILRRVA